MVAGLRGFEHAATAAVLRVAARLDRRELRGSVVAVPVASPHAFEQRVERSEEDTVRWIDALRSEVDALVVLRAGHPHEAYAPLALGRADLVAATGLPYALRGRCRPDLVAYAGGGARVDQPAVRALAGAVRGVLCQLGMLPGETAAARQRTVGRVVHERAPATGWWTPAVHLGEEVVEGALLGRVRDLHGTVLADVRSRRDGVVLALTTSPAVTRRRHRLLSLGVEPSASG